MIHSTVVPPDTLRAHLRDPGWCVFDCRFDLRDPGAGRRAYAEGHVPGARYADLDVDLAGPRGERGGRHPLPDPEAFARRLGRWGVGPQTQVVVYDDAGGAYAARLWWMLRWLGHEAAAVLDGGWGAWTQSSAPVETAAPPPRHAPSYPARARADWVVDAHALQAELAAGRCRLVDARSAERFRGDCEPYDPVAGHVPAARNHPYRRNLDGHGRFLPRAQLREALAPCLEGCVPAQVVQMCGSGVTACHNLLAMELAGLAGARLYPGSWSDWIADPARPVARGES